MSDNERKQEQGPRVSHEDEDDPLCSAQAEAETYKRLAGCQCTTEEGDSPCPVHVSPDDELDKLPAVVAYIERNGKLLSISRKDTGEHAVPGGKCESGETPGQALIREVREEAGVRIVSATKVYCGRHTSGRIVIAYRCRIEGEPIAVEAGTRAEWVMPEDIANGFGAQYHRKALAAAGYLPEWDAEGRVFLLSQKQKAELDASVNKACRFYREALSARIEHRRLVAAGASQKERAAASERIFDAEWAQTNAATLAIKLALETQTKEDERVDNNDSTA